MAHCVHCENTKKDGPWGKKGRIQQVGSLKLSYRGKNNAGGRKCVFATAPGYRSFTSVAVQWYGWEKLQTALRLRRELVATLAGKAGAQKIANSDNVPEMEQDYEPRPPEREYLENAA